MEQRALEVSFVRGTVNKLATMVSWIVSSLALCALASVGFSFPLIEEHQEIGLQEPQPIVGHEEIIGHQVGLSHELPEIQKFEGIEKFEPKKATSYQSLHIQTKHAVPVVVKTTQIHPPTFKHFSGIGEASASVLKQLPEQHATEHHISSNSNIQGHFQGQHIQEQLIQGQHFQGEHFQGQHFQGEHIQGHFQGEHIQGQHFQGEHIQEQLVHEQPIDLKLHHGI